MIESQAIGPTSLDFPAWVQAIGSILAILVSVWIVRSDEIRRRRVKLEKDASFALFIQQSIKGLYDDVGPILGSISREIPEEASEFYNPDRYIEVLKGVEDKLQGAKLRATNLISAFPLEAWPDMQFAYYFFEQIGRFERDIEWISNIRRVGEKGDPEEFHNEVLPLVLVADEMAEYFDYEFHIADEIARELIDKARRKGIKLRNVGRP